MRAYGGSEGLDDRGGWGWAWEGASFSTVGETGAGPGPGRRGEWGRGQGAAGVEAGVGLHASELGVRGLQ